MFVVLGGASADTGAGSEYGASFTASLDAGGLFVLQIVTFVSSASSCRRRFVRWLDIADGRPVTVAFVLQTAQLRQRHPGRSAARGDLSGAELLSLLPGFLFALLSLVLIFVFGFFTLFTIAFATDRALAPIDAVKASYQHGPKANVGETLLSLLVQGLVLVAGFIACGVGSSRPARWPC